MGAIRKATAAEECTDKHALVRYKVIVGYGPHNTTSSHDAHSLYIVVHYTCCIIGESRPQESTSHESCACAEHFGFGRLIALGRQQPHRPRPD